MLPNRSLAAWKNPFSMDPKKVTDIGARGALKARVPNLIRSKRMLPLILASSLNPPPDEKGYEWVS